MDDGHLTCTCAPTPPEDWTIHSGATDPASLVKFDPGCPEHGSGPVPGDRDDGSITESVPLDGSSDPLVATVSRLLDQIPQAPWFWRGNIDHREDVYLAARTPGLGVVSVLSTVPEAMSDEDWGRMWDDDGDLQEYLDRDDFIASKDTEEPRRHLAFLDSEGGYMMQVGRERPVFEVARNQNLPDDTPRDHPKVYRGDVVEVRNPVAQLLALSREMADKLIEQDAEIARLRAMMNRAAARTQ